MTLEQKYNELLALVTNLSEPDKSEENLQSRKEYTSERSMGNYDDVFFDGSSCAEAHTALACREVLNKIKTE